MSTPVRLAAWKGPRCAAAIDVSLLWLWLSVVSLAPVWFGSNNPLAWGSHAAVIGLLLMAYGAVCLVFNKPLPIPLMWLLVPLVALGIVIGWGAIQTVAWVPAAWRHPIWAMASSILERDVPGTISVYPAAGRMAILWIATVAAVFFLAAQLGRDVARARVIMLVLAITGGAIAAYGLVVYVLGNRWVLWTPKHAYLTALTATFINRNNFAAYAGITVVCAFGLGLDGALSARICGSATASTRPVLGRALMLGLLGVIILALCAALILTGSRAGLVVTFLGILVISVLQFARLKAGRVAVAVALALLLVAIVVFSAEIGDFLIVRLSTLDQSFADRMSVDARVLAAIKASPLLGYGLGAFEQAFPMFPDANLVPHNRWEYAHNDWLEALMTLGIPVGLVVWLIFGWILVRCVVGALRRGRDEVYSAIGAAACVVVLVHSLVDFSLQIQGFTIPLMAMLGVGVSQSWSTRTQE
jgi:O-antigen ligase